MSRRATGKCLCGAVQFSATEVPDTYGVCHCEMCRRWTGSALIGVSIPKEKVAWRGEEHIASVETSNWARRGWCKKCGSNLYFQFTGEGKWTNEVEIPLGLFDDPNGFSMRSEIWIDEKPDSYSYVGDGHKRLTRAEVLQRATFIPKEKS